MIVDKEHKINLIISDFHSTVFKILKICKKIEPNNLELEWLQKKLSLARDIDHLLIITRCKDKIWLYREHILSENEDFFEKNQYSQFIKDDENKPFMNSLISLIKSKFKELSTPEKKTIWRLIQDLLASVGKYKKITEFT